MSKHDPVSPKEIKVARDCLERYSGSHVDEFCNYVILTNFPKYVERFAEDRNLEISQGSMFTAAHCKEEDISILDFKIGSTAAALVVDLCSYLPIQACLLLGMCAGLRRRYTIGDYLLPVAAIRGEGTSDHYFPLEVPALSNFLVQRAVSEILDEEKATYHIGITHTTNKRFWEFDTDFIERLKSNRSQALELECATLFSASYKRKLPLGALLLISDLPLDERYIKTKEISDKVYKEHMSDHISKGIKIVHRLKRLQDKKKSRGAFRPSVDKVNPNSPPET